MVKLKNSTKRIVPLLGLMGLLLFQFQNCAKKEFAFEDSLVTETMDYFEYRYEKATPIYFEVQVLPSTSDATYQSYDILGFATPSDGSEVAIDWKINLYDTSGAAIGVQKTGQLAAGETRISETYTTYKTKKIGSAVIQVKKATEVNYYEYKKIYNY